MRNTVNLNDKILIINRLLSCINIILFCICNTDKLNIWTQTFLDNLEKLLYSSNSSARCIFNLKIMLLMISLNFHVDLPLFRASKVCIHGHCSTKFIFSLSSRQWSYIKGAIRVNESTRKTQIKGGKYFII